MFDLGQRVQYRIINKIPNFTDINKSQLAINIAKSNNLDDVVIMQQVHGELVYKYNPQERQHNHASINNLPVGDGAVSSVSGVGLAVYTADCASVVLAAKDQSVVGIAHCGHKGANSCLLASVVDRMRQYTDSEIQAVIGPCIDKEYLEVGLDFQSQYIDKDPQAWSYFFTNRRGKAAFDLRGYICSRLWQLRVYTISHHIIDTYTNYQYGSYRRASMLGVKDNSRCITLVFLKH